MPAQVAIRCETNVRAFYKKFVGGRGMATMVAIVAVMLWAAALYLRNALGTTQTSKARSSTASPRKWLRPLNI